MNNKIQQGAAAIALIVLVSIFCTTIRAVARAGPLIQTPTVTPSPSPSSTPSPSPSVTPSNTPTETPKPTETMSAEQALYATRGWATITPTPTQWPIILPCDNNFPYSDTEEIYRQRVVVWYGWVQRYKDRGFHDLPVEIPLSVLMHESRGSNAAVGRACEIGLFQIIPGDASPDCPQIPENPTIAQLIQSSKNVYHGIGRLEEYSCVGHYLISGEDPIHRFERYVSYPEASNLIWWYSSEGRATLAMFQCGPTGLANEICNERIGGYVYAENILGCWVPWIQDVMIENKLLEE